MATARRVGTNEQVLTYGSPGRDYDEGEWSVWEAATDTDHVTDTETDVLEHYDDQATFDDNISPGGSTNNSTYFRIMRPASGQGHDGTPNNGVEFVNTTGVNTLFLTETNTQIQDLIISASINDASGFNVIQQRGTDSAMVGIICADFNNAGAGIGAAFQALIGDNIAIIVCLAHNAEGDGFRLSVSTPDNSNAYNCVATNNGDRGYEEAGDGDNIVINCLGADNTSSDYDTGFSGTSDYNASKDATAPGGNSRQSQTFTFVNAGGDDFHLDSADAGAKGFGTDLSGDGTFAFDDDIDGDTMSDWPIGFDEPTTAIPIFMHHFSKNIIPRA